MSVGERSPGTAGSCTGYRSRTGSTTAGRSCKRSSPAAGLTVPRYGPGHRTKAGPLSLSGCLERMHNICLSSFLYFSFLLGG